MFRSEVAPEGFVSFVSGRHFPAIIKANKLLHRLTAFRHERPGRPKAYSTVARRAEANL